MRPRTRLSSGRFSRHLKARGGCFKRSPARGTQSSFDFFFERDKPVKKTDLSRIRVLARRNAAASAQLAVKKWSGRPESNRRSQLGKLEHNHFATPAKKVHVITYLRKPKMQARNGAFSQKMLSKVAPICLSVCKFPLFKHSVKSPGKALSVDFSHFFLAHAHTRA